MQVLDAQRAAGRLPLALRLPVPDLRERVAALFALAPKLGTIHRWHQIDASCIDETHYTRWRPLAPAAPACARASRGGGNGGGRWRSRFGPDTRRLCMQCCVCAAAQRRQARQGALTTDIWLRMSPGHCSTHLPPRGASLFCAKRCPRSTLARSRRPILRCYLPSAAIAFKRRESCSQTDAAHRLERSVRVHAVTHAGDCWV